MRYGAPLAIAVFAVALCVGVFGFVRWTLALRRMAAALERTGQPGKAELLRMQFRTALIGGSGTLLFVAVFWFAVLRDLRCF